MFCKIKYFCYISVLQFVIQSSWVIKKLKFIIFFSFSWVWKLRQHFFRSQLSKSEFTKKVFTYSIWNCLKSLWLKWIWRNVLVENKNVENVFVYFLLQHVSINASIYTLVVISLDRYRGIMWPLKGEYSKFKAKMVLVLVWLVSIGLAIPNLVVFYVRNVFYFEYFFNVFYVRNLFYF